MIIFGVVYPDELGWKRGVGGVFSFLTLLRGAVFAARKPHLQLSLMLPGEERRGAASGGGAAGGHPWNPLSCCGVRLSRQTAVFAYACAGMWARPC